MSVIKKTGIGILIVSAFVLMSCEDPLEKLKDEIISFDKVYDEYEKIAEATGGTITEAKDAEDLPVQISQVIQKHAQEQVGAEIMLLIDKTASMRDDIDAVVSGLSLIIDELPVEARLGLATYGDKNVDGSDWYTFKDFTMDHDSIIDELNIIETTGGGDWPESVYDGIYSTIEKASWGGYAPLRMIICIGDAAPLTGDQTDYTLDDIKEKVGEVSPSIQIHMIAIRE
ncbi:MAG: VWA domain-containing protein [Spirochaetes bacterium]|jgi:hypothetical protein|nr:VWA domain-containing protein [Spirochaetota bacterium]